MNELKANTNNLNRPNRYGSFRKDKRSRRFGWLSVVFAVIANALLFLSINWVNSAPAASLQQEHTVIELFSPEPVFQDLPQKIDPKPLRPERIISAALKPMQAKTDQSVFRPRLTEWVPDSLLDQAGISIDISPPVSDIIDNAEFGVSTPMEINQVDSPPTKISGSAPTYPRWARPSRSEGTVTLRFVVGADGKVSNVKVQRVKGDKRFGAAAVRSVKKWRFKPAIDNGVRVAVWGIQTISFQFKGKY